jgi:hypothetical protein
MAQSLNTQLEAAKRVAVTAVAIGEIACRYCKQRRTIVILSMPIIRIRLTVHIEDDLRVLYQHMPNYD